MKKDKPTKQPRRCTRCGGIGHRADGRSCPLAPTELVGAKALHAYVLEDLAVTIIVGGQAQETLLLALRSMETAPQRAGASLVNAYRTLAERAQTVPDDTIERARKARAALDAAQAEYAEAVAPIRKVIKAP